MTDLPKEISVIKVDIKELPDNEFEASYFIYDEFLFSIIFPNADIYKDENGIITTKLALDLFIQFTHSGPIPLLLRYYTQLTPLILNYISDNPKLKELLESLAANASNFLCLESCTCDHCFQTTNTVCSSDKLN